MKTTKKEMEKTRRMLVEAIAVAETRERKGLLVQCLKDHDRVVDETAPKPRRKMKRNLCGLILVPDDRW